MLISITIRMKGSVFLHVDAFYNYVDFNFILSFQKLLQNDLDNQKKKFSFIEFLHTELSYCKLYSDVLFMHRPISFYAYFLSKSCIY